MVFSSLFFIYMFLALNLAVYALVPGIKWKNAVLLIFSLCFYAFTGPRYILLILGMAAVSWAGGLLVDLYKNHLGRKRFFMTLDVILMLGILVFFKYTGFLLGTTQALFGIPKFIPEIVLPIGISFYTFQLLSYTADVYRGIVPVQRNYLHLLLYTALFHQCIAGPIVRYSTVSNEITSRKVTAADISAGILRFSIGLAKKSVLANTCARIVKDMVPATTEGIQTAPSMSIWLGMLAFVLQLYLDFSAYSDMAIGMGRMIGFHYDENFNYPYIANSVTDYWRRWHISLSSFFKDYVYIPLGGSRKGLFRTILNLFVVWTLTGLWHGGSWNYVLWGLYTFCFLAAEKIFILKVFDRLPKMMKPLQHLYTLAVIFPATVIFYFESLPQLGAALSAMVPFLSNGQHPFISIQTTMEFKNYLFLLIFAVISCMPIYRTCHKYLEELSHNKPIVHHILGIADILTIVFCLCISTLALVGDSYNPFLYFRF